MRILVSVCRVLVGSLFIVSGLIKANDALGFGYKLSEYFSPEVLGWLAWMEPYAYPLAVFICIAEIVLGLATILGAKMKLTSWSLLLMIVFFTFLTFYSAYFNKVTDCGCFGDAIKLTPWESFTKDLVLLVLIIPIFLRRSSIKLNDFAGDLALSIPSVILIAIFSFGMLGWGFPVWFTLVIVAVCLLVKRLVNSQVEWMMALAAIIICAGFSYYTYAHLPIKDFRPYAVGKSIPDGLKTADELGLEPPEYANVYLLERKDGGEEEMYSNYWMEHRVWEDTETYVDPANPEATGEQVMLKDGYEPPIHDFEFTDANGDDMTYTLFAGKHLLVISYDLAKADLAIQPQLSELSAGLERSGVSVIGLTSGEWDAIESFRHDHQHAFPYLRGDGITLKTMVRATPGLIAIENGSIIGKWHYNDMPDLDVLANMLK